MAECRSTRLAEQVAHGVSRSENNQATHTSASASEKLTALDWLWSSRRGFGVIPGERTAPATNTAAAEQQRHPHIAALKQCSHSNAPAFVPSLTGGWSWSAASSPSDGVVWPLSSTAAPVGAGCSQWREWSGGGNGAAG